MQNSLSIPQSGMMKSALLLVDIQQFYFPPSPKALVNPEQASANAGLILKKFRESGQLVIHVQHFARQGFEIHPNVAPIAGEKVILKKYPNSFRETDLLEYLQSGGINHLVVCGMMTHMCVEAVTRAATDMGYKCMVISDACATRDLKFEDTFIPAEQVHYSSLSSIAFAYGKVGNTKQFLEEFQFNR
jgi:nicotinamidase-related amidase